MLAASINIPFRIFQKDRAPCAYFTSYKITGLVTLPDSDGVELYKDGVLEEGQHAEHEQEDPFLTTRNFTHA